ncbi:serine hydrolase [Bythopirellula goksoeyrii]|uniref:serine hydrolase n=1 Tax=Bythopirellula goksoeyrii TaxID=1400387 RepID=UPI001AEFBAFF|nr:serine hydrolase [Bythopirellula goksoeyrii]
MAFLACFALSIGTASAAELSPEKVKSALSGLEKVVNQTRQKTGVPGIAIAVVHQDEVVYLKGFGVRQSGHPSSVNADTVFQLASVSKPIATTVLAAMVGEGFIDWDDRVIDFDPGFRLRDPWVTREVTFRDLLCHRSGLPDHAGDLLEDLGYGQAEVFRRLRYLDTANNFRSQYAYTNFGFSEAGVAVARAAGTTWEDLCADKLYRPLGLNSTSSRFADFESAENRALLHVRVDGKWVAKHVRDPDAQSPAGGVSSTVRDMAQWMRLQLAEGQFDGKQIVAAAALDETHRPQIVSRPPQNPATDRAGWYALGWNVSYNDGGRIMLGHSGAFDMGAATVVNLLPAENLGIVVLTNAAPIGAAEAIAASYLDLVQTGKVERDWLKFFTGLIESTAEPATDYSQRPTEESPPLSAESYVGTYRNSYFGEIEVSNRKGALQLSMGPKQTLFPLRHRDRDVFIYKPAGEMASGLSAVTFRIGTNLQATTVTVENLDINGLGTFSRSPSEK